ncbi:hypothetical protein ACQGAO_31740 [Rhodococcus sp. 1.20]|uniref:hypothetical protein n=1 Tax=Rhodococcus TaxID=1827 RepID=UPI001BA70DFE|nr:hypothetical protein [Rhodococcus qingshengii]MBS3693904.1 hypothetical protein [Rhodococcus qingshengii]
MSPLFVEPRLDHLVTEAVSGQLRRSTQYSGVLWIGGEPPGAGRVYFMRSVSKSKPRAVSMFLPDSLPYLGSEATVVTHTWVSSGPGDPNPIIVAASAVLVPDPRDVALRWLQLSVSVAGSVPVGIGYRVTVETHPESVRR